MAHAGWLCSRKGLMPAAVLRQLLAEDGGFEGRGPDARQVGLVSITGAAAAHTGADAAAADWAGSQSGPGFSVQGNGLAGPQVLDAMANAFAATAGPLADRLMAALRAGDRAGGQRTGRQSAALLVRTPEGFPLDVDLRIDDAGDPVAALSRLYDLQASRQTIIQARLTARRGDTAGARALLRAATARAHAWPRVLILAAEVATELEEPAAAMRDIAVAFAANPRRRAATLGRGTFAALGHQPMFHRWIDAETRRRVREDAQALGAMPRPAAAALPNSPHVCSRSGRPTRQSPSSRPSTSRLPTCCSCGHSAGGHEVASPTRGRPVAPDWPRRRGIRG